FSAAKCQPQSGTSLLANICLRCWKGHDGEDFSVFTATKGTLSEATAPLLLQRAIRSAEAETLCQEPGAWMRQAVRVGHGWPYPNGPAGTTLQPKAPRSGARTARQQQRRCGKHSGVHKKSRHPLKMTSSIEDVRISQAARP
ncbi:hypothetical protein, partial [Candidatus Pantoea formicae]|uniref:hypothetical protein n=1 Tax=Candidatus Pantoea formicae TaxID=2608355 RepID=UPI003EDA0CD4